MEKKNIRELFVRYLNDDYSAEDLDRILHYFSLSQHNEELDELIISALNENEVYDAQLIQEIDKNIRENIFAKTRGFKKRNKWQKYGWLKYAAILCLALLCKDTTRERLQPLITKTDLMDVGPGEHKAILVTSAGDSLMVGRDYQSIVIMDNRVYTNDSAGRLIYSYPLIGEVELITPKGSQFHIILQDGTKVWLNANSKLTYPTEFGSKQRMVSLIGEGYFEVYKDIEKPFVVSTNKQKVKVLGTTFNISSYPDEGFESTSLIEGKVQVKVLERMKEFVLNPAEQLHINDIGEAVINSIDPVEYGYWKDGTLLLNNNNLGQIIRQLERWYDVQFDEIPADLSDIRFFGVIDKTLSLSEVLRILKELNNDVEFTIAERRVIIKKR